ncbi:unnamed protein product [Diatraea saccharalis]|uniref:ascorbate ferrireductase (transmembrane) n=1 Tax=Diatraea saccharalis TaxID=40085 RepID=A0A9N9WKX8_9NEOP|nr:unnamed protein product [Diatraea saccharalis]
MTATTQDSSSPLTKTLDILNTITTLAIGALAMGGITGGIVFKTFTQFSAHIFLVTFGFVLIISQGVMSANPTGGWARTFSYKHKRNIHIAMQIIGSILAIAGAGVGMSLRSNNNLSRSAHGIMGITTFVIVIITLLGGCVHVFFNSFLPSNLTKAGHRIFGCLSVLFVFVTFTLGLEKLYSGTDIFIAYVILAVISICGIVAAPVTNVFRRG